MTCHKTTTVLCPSGGMADTPVLGTGVARREGSTPFSDTKTSLSNNTGLQICCTRCCIDDKMLQQSKTSLSNNTGIDFEITKLTKVITKLTKKFVAKDVALKTECCKVENGMYEGFNSRPYVILRN